MATVSRVLNKTRRVSPDIEEAVRKAAKELDYTPNLFGKNLRKRHTGIILVMLASLNNSFCSKVVTGITEEAEKRDYSILVCPATRGSENKNVYLGLVKNRMADGLIVLDSVLAAEELSSVSEAAPVVQVSEYIAGSRVPYVSIDNRLAAKEATAHLLKSGRKRILFVGGFSDKSCSPTLRLAGYREALEEHGIPFDKSLLLSAYSYRDTAAAMTKYISEGHSFDAVFAISDRMAASALVTMKKQGIRVPEDVAVIGFDNTDLTYMVEPNLSTVSQPQLAMGQRAFQMLYEQLKGGEAKSVFLPHELIIRSSSK